MCTMVAQVCDADYHDLLGVEEGFMWSIFPDYLSADTVLLLGEVKRD